MVLSLDELIASKKAADAKSKPRFVSKAERAKRASVHEPPSAPNRIAKLRGNVAKSLLTKNSESAPVPFVSAEAQKGAASLAANAKKASNEPFAFGWKLSDNTLPDNDDLYSLQAASAERGGSRSRPQGSRRTGGQREDHDSPSMKPLSEMTERDWRIFCLDEEITMKFNTTQIRPARSWAEISMPGSLRQAVRSLNFAAPTPVQKCSIPIAMANRDIVAIAQTGSGKTLAFLIPIISKLLSKAPSGDCSAVILAPTRELALQTESIATKLCAKCNLRCVTAVGGRSIDEQMNSISGGCDILVATPGRLIDLVDRNAVSLSNVSQLVLDEADRMIDIGFEPALQQILSSITSTHSTMMYTATWPQSVQALSSKYISPDAVRLEIGGASTSGAPVVVDTIEQVVEFISEDDKKQRRLLQLIRKNNPPIIVFVATRVSCEVLVDFLHNSGIRAVSLHGDKSQEQREAALQQLKDDAAHVLVATDVAGRGIDVAGVSLVVNYQMTKHIADYTHRIGRTGRAGKHGLAVTFVDQARDAAVLWDLKQMVQKSSRSKMPTELSAVRPPAS